MSYHEMMCFTVFGRFSQNQTISYLLLYRKERYKEHSGYNWRHGVHVTATNVLLQTLLITAKFDTMTFSRIKIIQILQILKYLQPEFYVSCCMSIEKVLKKCKGQPNNEHCQYPCIPFL